MLGDLTRLGNGSLARDAKVMSIALREFDTEEEETDMPTDALQGMLMDYD